MLGGGVDREGFLVKKGILELGNVPEEVKKTHLKKVGRK